MEAGEINVNKAKILGGGLTTYELVLYVMYIATWRDPFHENRIKVTVIIILYLESLYSFNFSP